MTAPAPIANAILVQFATYASPELHAATLRRWADAADGEVRRLHPAHDVTSALRQREHGPGTAADIAGWVAAVRDGHGLPAADRLGLTTVLVVTGFAEGRAADLVPDARGGPWDAVGELFTSDANDDLLIVCPPGDEADRRMSASLYGPIRLLETYRHKVEGQYARYESDYRGRLLAAVAALERELTGVAAGPGGPAAMTKRAAAVTAAYCAAAVVHSPVREVLAMLVANERNLAALLADAAGDGEPAGVRALRRRAARAGRRVGQVEADLGRAEPIFDAARWVGQFHHGQLLAEVSSAEQRENQQRDADAGVRDRHSRRLTVLAVWLGVSQVWAAWLAMWPTESRPGTLGYLLLLCFLPSVGGLLYAAAASRFATPSRASS